MMLDGTLCQECGVYIEEPGAGVPRSCNDCKSDNHGQAIREDEFYKKARTRPDNTVWQEGQFVGKLEGKLS